MSNEHTPGPWVWIDNPSGPWPRLVGPDEEDGWIAMSADPNSANGKLIAAAPETKKQRDELLWTLEYVRGELSGWTTSLGLTEVLRVIDSAIDKATGARALTDEILTGGTPEEFTAASLADLERMTEGE